MPRLWIRALFVLAITSSASAQNVPTIGLYADPGGTDCNVVTTLGTSVTAYVLLVPRNIPASLTEAHIRIELDPWSDLVTSVIPTPLATVAIGNPFASAAPGALLRVEICPTSTPVVLYTVTLMRMTGPAWEIRVATTAQWTTCSLETIIAGGVGTIDHRGSPTVPASPTPEDGATVLSACVTGGHQELRWSGVLESTVCRQNYWLVYFGRSSNPPFAWANYSFPGYDAGRLSYNATYYWRVETVVYNFGNPAPTILRGPLWRFTTGPPPPPQLPLSCPTTCDTLHSACPATCLFVDDPTLSSQCSNAVSGSYATERECGSGHSVHGMASFNRSSGSVQAEVTSDPQCPAVSVDVTCADRFWLEGTESSEPVAFSAYLGFGGGRGCLFAALREGTGPVTFVPPTEPQQYNGVLELPIRHAVGETFVLRYGVMVTAPDTGSQSNSGHVSGSLMFSRIPVGYQIMSCEGYAPPQSLAPSSWSSVKTLFR